MAVRFLNTYSLLVHSGAGANTDEFSTAPIFVKKHADPEEDDARLYSVYTLAAINAHIAEDSFFDEDAALSASDVWSKWTLIGVGSFRGQGIVPPASKVRVVTISLHGEVAVKNVWSDKELEVGDRLQFIVKREEEGDLVKVVPWAGQGCPSGTDLGYDGISIELGTVTTPTTVRLSVFTDDELALTGNTGHYRGAKKEFAPAECAILDRIAPGRVAYLESKG